MRAWGVLRQLLAVTLCALLAASAYSSGKTLPTIQPPDHANGGVNPKTRVWGSSERILLHFTAAQRLSGKPCWGCEERSKKVAVGSVVTYDYDAFGVLIHQTGATPNTTLYSGEQFDPDLNLYYNRARYLNTSSGRFWTADTYEGDSQSPLSLHRYLYARLDPVGRIDPLGTQDTATEAEAEAIGEIIDATPFVKGAALLLFLAAQFSGGTVENPDFATPDAGRDPRYPNRMRVQLQEGLDNTFYGVAQKNTDQVGVTVLQMRSVLQTLYNTASGDSATGRNAFPFNALNDWLVTSIIISSQKLGTYPPGGIFVPKKGFLNIPPIQYRGKEYRLDVDNLAGHNLRQ